MAIAIYLFIYNTTNCTNTKRDLSNNNNITNNNTRFIAILKTSQFWLTTLSSSLTYLALKTMADWTFLYLVEHAGSSTQVATELMVYNEVGGIAGTFLCGVLSIYSGRY